MNVALLHSERLKATLIHTVNGPLHCTGPRGLDRLMEILGGEGLGSVLHRAQAVEA